MKVLAVFKVADKELSRLGYHEVGEARDLVAEVLELGAMLVREREAVGGVFTPDWQLFREALTKATED